MFVAQLLITKFLNMLNEKVRDYFIIGIAIAVVILLIGSKVKAIITNDSTSVTDTKEEKPVLKSVTTEEPKVELI